MDLTHITADQIIATVASATGGGGIVAGFIKLLSNKRTRTAIGELFGSEGEKTIEWVKTGFEGQTNLIFQLQSTLRTQDERITKVEATNADLVLKLNAATMELLQARTQLAESTVENASLKSHIADLETEVATLTQQIQAAATAVITPPEPQA